MIQLTRYLFVDEGYNLRPINASFGIYQIKKLMNLIFIENFLRISF